ncbi:MAG: DUF1826 domain-containing protein [Rhodospirillaceae bacterium]|nr:DUF1826 domain-containing protein [Rhodospirillaceae bacterium]MDD9928636.1 DUF1826 domain-containing protein [Rhodospirillaceae bacterium]
MIAPLFSADGAFVSAQSAFGAGIESCASADGLSAFNGSGTELVIWQRTLPRQFRAWLEDLDPSALPHERFLVRPSEARCAVETVLTESGMPDGDMRALLVDDIDDLVSRFAEITHSEFVDVRLERISHDSCWKFHRDNVAARLLATYRGSATQWIQPSHAEQAVHEQKDYNGPIETLQSNDVAIFKGRAAASGSGIVHRSPPIAGTGQTRLLLCLNQRSEISPAPWPTNQGDKAQLFAPPGFPTGRR